MQNARQLRCPRPFFSVVGMWSSWFTSGMLQYPNRQTAPEQRQTIETWHALHACSMPPVVRDFVKAVLWLKIKTLERLHPWLQEPTLCPICAMRETHAHVLSKCKYLCFAAKVGPQCFDDMTVR